VCGVVGVNLVESGQGSKRCRGRDLEKIGEALERIQMHICQLRKPPLKHPKAPNYLARTFRLTYPASHSVRRVGKTASSQRRNGDVQVVKIRLHVALITLAM